MPLKSLVISLLPVVFSLITWNKKLKIVNKSTYGMSSVNTRQLQANYLESFPSVMIIL